MPVLSPGCQLGCHREPDGTPHRRLGVRQMTEGYLAVSPAAGRHAYPNLCCSVGSDPRGFDALNHPYHQQHCIDNAIVASGKRRRPCQRRMRHPVRSPSRRGGSRSRSCWRGGLTHKICDVMTQGKRAGQR